MRKDTVSLNIVLLSGGSGKRLWPLSNDVRSKQFLKIFKTNNGDHESMVQRMYRMIRDVDTNSSITIATSSNQISLIRSQLGNEVGISVEPCRRDTFPAIALATAYLHDIKGISSEEVVVVCPVDPYVEVDYFFMLKKLSDQAEKGEANLVLMGIEPSYPSEKYGYIIPENSDGISVVKTFKEKPDTQTAAKYISQGGLWNAGVFAYKLKYILDIAEKIFGSSDYQYLYDNYSSLTKISFDYAVAEKEKKIQVIRFNGEWKDLGTWDTLTESLSDSISGNTTAVDCTNTHIINELSIPLIAIGADNLAIVATADGVLVTNKDKSDKLKEYVANDEPMCEKCDWGKYKVLDRSSDGESKYLIKHICINPNTNVSFRQEGFNQAISIIRGSGSLKMNNTNTDVCQGSQMNIPPMTEYTIESKDELHIVAIQSE